MGDFDWFIQDFDGKTAAVARATQPSSLLVTLKDWVSVFANYPEPRSIVTDLNSRVDFDAWYVNQPQPTQGLPRLLEWPTDTHQSLAMRFRLMLRLADGSINFASFVMERVGGNISMQVKLPAFIEQIFSPLAHDLRIYILRQHQVAETNKTEIPASDRIVSIKHNQPDIAAFDKDISELDEALRGLNDFGQSISEQRAKAEVTAFKTIMSQEEVNLEVAEPLFKSFTNFLKDKIAGPVLVNLLMRIIANWDKLWSFIERL